MHALLLIALTAAVPETLPHTYGPASVIFLREPDGPAERRAAPAARAHCCATLGDIKSAKSKVDDEALKYIENNFEYSQKQNRWPDSDVHCATDGSRVAEQLRQALGKACDRQ